jgi:hypothetical protein
MKIHNPARLLLRTAVLLFLPLAAWAISSCNSGGVSLPLLTDIFIKSCDKSTVLLSGFWWLAVNNTSTPPVPTQPTPAIDPLGGSLFIYWIDDQGNVCHGEPGTSGQPGAYEIPAYNPDVLSAPQQTSVISDEQLRTYQEASFDISPYLKDFKPSGPHLVQFAGWIWQDRQTGKAFIDKTRLFYSVPQIGEVNKPFCYLPAYPVKGSVCDTPTPLKPSAYITTQHPSLCQKRAFPTTDAVLASERVQYCLSALPHGLETTSRQP